ncbi:UNKNOWN [Stylonychia lemnae]|uniref:Uncharacterized protein n=1 Tax=Stylonychia lemnae TaxID=5949 RepID=A0A077ZS42_STYLE|nr:UNKNOWN [Stylonychia lemnae]|eukprot:CDW72190.1 UNKNOWN [Stylonychia lemnae]
MKATKMIWLVQKLLNSNYYLPQIDKNYRTNTKIVVETKMNQLMALSATQVRNGFNKNLPRNAQKIQSLLATSTDSKQDSNIKLRRKADASQRQSQLLIQESKFPAQTNNSQYYLQSHRVFQSPEKNDVQSSFQITFCNDQSQSKLQKERVGNYFKTDTLNTPKKSTSNNTLLNTRNIKIDQPYKDQNKTTTVTQQQSPTIKNQNSATLNIKNSSFKVQISLSQVYEKLNVRKDENLNLYPCIKVMPLPSLNHDILEPSKYGIKSFMNAFDIKGVVSQDINTISLEFFNFNQ